MLNRRDLAPSRTACLKLATDFLASPRHRLLAGDLCQGRDDRIGDVLLELLVLEMPANTHVDDDLGDTRQLQDVVQTNFSMSFDHVLFDTWLRAVSWSFEQPFGILLPTTSATWAAKRVQFLATANGDSPLIHRTSPRIELEKDDRRPRG